MNKKRLLYKYAKAYRNVFIKYADYTPLPNSGVLQLEKAFKKNGIPTDFMYTVNPETNEFSNMYNAIMDMEPVGNDVNIIDRLDSTREMHNALQQQRRNIQSAHNMRNILLPTYTPEQQQIIKQIQLVPSDALYSATPIYSPSGNMLGTNTVALTPHELEHAVDYTRRRLTPSDRFNEDVVLALNNIDSIRGTPVAHKIYRGEQIANTVPQLRLRRLWGNNLNKDQMDILQAVEQAAIESNNSYKALLDPNIVIDPIQDIEAMNRVPNVYQQVYRQARRQGVYSKAPELTTRYDLDPNGNRLTLWDNYLTNAQAANVDPSIIAQNEQNFRTAKSIERYNKRHPNSQVNMPTFNLKQPQLPKRI